MIGNFLDFVSTYKWQFLSGTLITIRLSLIAVSVGLILGMFVALLRLTKNKVLRWLSTSYVELIRGTPLLVQVMIFYYGLITFIPEDMLWLRSRWVLATAAICMNSSAYVAEIIRGGINSVDKGQMEAARSLGLTYGQSMKEVVIPQAIKNILPSLGNEFISLIKETAIVTMVGIPDLMHQANVVRSVTFKAFAPLLTAAAIYFTLTYSLSRLIAIMERRLSAGDKRS